MASTKIEILKIPVIPNIQHGYLLPATLLMESYTGVSLWIVRNFQEQLFYGTPLTASKFFNIITFKDCLWFYLYIFDNFGAT